MDDYSKLEKSGQISAHPPTRRGVQITSSAPLSSAPYLHPTGEAPAQLTLGGFILDWLTFTLPLNEASFLWIAKNLGTSLPRPAGALGYAQSESLLGSGLMCYSGADPERGLCVVLPASALSHLSLSVSELFLELSSMGASCSRLDFALDDYEGLLDLDEIERKLAYGEVSTRWKNYEQRTGKVGIGSLGVGEGRTIYLGSRTSETFARLYDKNKEQAAKNPDFVPLAHWVRFEIEVKKRRAQQLFEALVSLIAAGSDDIGGFLAGYVRGLVDFKEPDYSDTNKSRWATVSWWDSFLSFSAKLRLTFPKGIDTVEKLKRWVLRSVSPMLAVLATVDNMWLDEVVSAGQNRWSMRHYKLLQGVGAV